MGREAHGSHHQVESLYEYDIGHTTYVNTQTKVRL
jgi:hypothetical protein